MVACIAHSNVIVVRPNKELLSGIYLKLFLDSPLGNKILTAKQQGTVVINISYKDLKSMEVPVPPMDEQIAVEKEYNEELSRYLELAISLIRTLVASPAPIIIILICSDVCLYSCKSVLTSLYIKRLAHIATIRNTTDIK